MRLRGLTLSKYGNYDAERIGFSPEKGVVNLLLAPNGAGKSVLRQAFGDLLFGIGNQTSMGFRHGYNGMRVTAEIARPDGTSVSFIRPKARGNPVLGLDGEPLAPGFLASILGSRDKPLLERLFALDTAALREGGRALLESGGDVASALLSAAGGIRQARALKQKLERRRDDLAPERRTGSRPFYQALDQFNDARRRAAAATLRPDQWEKQEQTLAALEETRRASQEAAATAFAEIARLERVRRVGPPLSQRAEVEAWLAAHPDARALDPSLTGLLTQARLDLSTSETAAKDAVARLAAAEQVLAGITVDEALLAHADQISRLVLDAGAARKARDDDLPVVRGQHEHRVSAILVLSRQLGLGLSPDQVTANLPSRALVSRTRQRIREFNDLSGRTGSLPGQIAARTRDLADLDQQLLALPPVEDVRLLEAQVSAIGADGDPIRRRDDARRAVAQAEAAVAHALDRVPGWTHDAAALAALRPLTPEQYRRHHEAVEEARQGVREAQDRASHAAETVARAGAALAAKSDGGAIPDAAEQARSRAARDLGWQLIYRTAFGGDPPSVEEVRAFTGGEPLPLAFERAIAAADRIADRRVAGQGRLAEIEAASRAAADAAHDAEAAAERLRLANERLSQAQREWSQICGGLGLGDGPSLLDVQTFQTAREAVLKARQTLAEAVDGLKAVDERHAVWAAGLAEILGTSAGDLPGLLSLARQRLEKAREAEAVRIDLTAQRTKAAKELRDATRAREEADQQTALWREQWRAVLVELGRPEDESPDETEAVLQALEEISQEHRAAVSLAERIDGMTRDVDRFTRAAAASRAALPAIPLPDDPFTAVLELGKRLAIERAADQRRAQSRQARDAEVARCAAADQAQGRARAGLSAVLGTIGAATIEEAEQRLALSAERARQDARRAAADAALRDAGGGLSLEALAAEVASVDAAAIPALIQDLEARHKAATDEAQRAFAEASVLRQTMDQDAASTAVNAAVADQQAAASDLSRTLEEAVTLHLASLMLGQALEVVEKSSDPAMLRRLSAIFSDLTNGVYTRVTTEPEEDGTAHLSLIQRDFPDERQSTAQLSEGTRDQLFLALRVAAIEDHVRDSEALPFIGDDILQTFDDDRVRSALRVLTDLSQHTQVIILTHHRHVLDLARQTGAVHVCERRAV